MSKESIATLYALADRLERADGMEESGSLIVVPMTRAEARRVVEALRFVPSENAPIAAPLDGGPPLEDRPHFVPSAKGEKKDA